MKGLVKTLALGTACYVIIKVIEKKANNDWLKWENEQLKYENAILKKCDSCGKNI